MHSRAAAQWILTIYINDGSFPCSALQLTHLDVAYDSDGLLTISDPVQETLTSLIKTHRDEVLSLRKELCITR